VLPRLVGTLTDGDDLTVLRGEAEPPLGEQPGAAPEGFARALDEVLQTARGDGGGPDPLRAVPRLREQVLESFV